MEKKNLILSGDATMNIQNAVVSERTKSALTCKAMLFDIFHTCTDLIYSMGLTEACEDKIGSAYVDLDKVLNQIIMHSIETNGNDSKYTTL